MSDVAKALGRLMRAQSYLDKAEESCDYDQDYFLAREYQEVEDAELAFIEALKVAIGVKQP